MGCMGFHAARVALGLVNHCETSNESAWISTDGTLAPTHLDIALYLWDGIRPLSAAVPAGLRLGTGVDSLASQECVGTHDGRLANIAAEPRGADGTPAAVRPGARISVLGGAKSDR